VLFTGCDEPNKPAIQTTQSPSKPMVKQYPSSLVTLPVQEILWSDWGTASRIKEVLDTIGKVPRLDGSRQSTGKKLRPNIPLPESFA
jgi:hypothetical protein